MQAKSDHQPYSFKVIALVSRLLDEPMYLCVLIIFLPIFCSGSSFRIFSFLTYYVFCACFKQVLISLLFSFKEWTYRRNKICSIYCIHWEWQNHFENYHLFPPGLDCVCLCFLSIFRLSYFHTISSQYLIPLPKYYEQHLSLDAVLPIISLFF